MPTNRRRQERSPDGGLAMSSKPPAPDQPFPRSAVFGAGDEEPDAALVRQCRSGDSRSFDRLVLRYQRVLYNVTLRMLDDPDDAMGATQSAFVKAYERLASFDPSRRFFSWLYRIALNEALDRRRRRRVRVPLSERIVAPDPDPARMAADHETEWMIRDALRQLSPVRREVVVLRHFAGLSYQEIADALDVPEKTVKSRLFDARRKLAELLMARGVVR